MNDRGCRKKLFTHSQPTPRLLVWFYRKCARIIFEGDKHGRSSKLWVADKWRKRFLLLPMPLFSARHSRPFCVLISETNYFVCRWVIVFLTPAPCTVLIIQQLTRQWKNKQLCFPKYWLAAVWSWSNAAKWDICCSHKSLSPPSPLVFRDVQSLLHTKPPGIPAVLLLKRSTVHNFPSDTLSFRSFPSFNKLLWDLF